MANLLDGWLKVDLGEGAFYALLGFLFVFVGILILVVIFTLLGMVMKRLNGKTKKDVEAPPVFSPVEKTESGISPETVAAITAAIMCYYQKENIKCDFVVRRIKRIERSQDHA